MNSRQPLLLCGLGMRQQCLLQGRSAAGMDTHHGNPVLLGLLGGADDHFVGDGICKQDHQIGGTDLFLHGAVLLGEDLGLIAMALTDFLIAADHTFVAANNYYAHCVFLSLITCG